MDREIIKKAAEYFGKEHQTSKAIEELSELSIELSKAINNAADVDHIAEEIADVMIMCEQLMVLYNNEEQVKKMTAFKLGRLDLTLNTAMYTARATRCISTKQMKTEAE